MAAALTARELERRLLFFEGVSDAELARLPAELAAAGAEIRTRAELRRAVDELGAACMADAFADREAAERLVELSRRAKYEYCIPAYLKALGRRALAAGDFAEAMTRFEESVRTGHWVAFHPDPRSRACLAYYHDREIDEAYEFIAARLCPRLSAETRGGPRRVAILTSSLQVQSATTAIVERYVSGLQQRGLVVSVVTTEVAPSDGSPALQRVRRAGAEVLLPAGSPVERLAQIFAYFAERPADATLWYVWPIDAVAKVASAQRLAPQQVFVNNTCEHWCGLFDLLLYIQSPREVAWGTMRGERRYVREVIAAGSRVEAAEPFDRARFGLAGDHVVLGTFGRLEKCCDWNYTAALGRVLRAAPLARLILAGPTSEYVLSILRPLFEYEGVADRVIYAGDFPDGYHGIYKMTDVYCDTLFWRGGQSILEAMTAGLPVVAMRSQPDSVLDPTGCGPMSNSADLLGPGAQVAPPGDFDAYVELATAYIADTSLRRSTGDAMRAQASSHNEEAHIDRVFAALGGVS